MMCETIETCVEEAGETLGLKTAVVSPRGVVTVDRAEAFDQLLETAAGNGARQIIVDLSAAELLGAAALGVIVGRRHQLTLRRPSNRLAKQLRIVGLDQSLRIHF